MVQNELIDSDSRELNTYKNSILQNRLNNIVLARLDLSIEFISDKTIINLCLGMERCFMVKWIKEIVIVLFIMLLGVTQIDAQVHAALPQFKSGGSLIIGAPVDFNALYQRVDALYDVREHDESHIIWEFTGTTGDTGFAFSDGRIITASTVNLDFAAIDALNKELNEIIDLINIVNPGIITNEARDNAFDSAVYYAEEPDIYHRIKYNFDEDFELKLKVPNSAIRKARLTVLGTDCHFCNEVSPYLNQAYFINGKKVASCKTEACGGLCGPEYRTVCSVAPVEITNRIAAGENEINAEMIDSHHTMIIDVLTASEPKKLVLYGPGYIPWINETTRSLGLDALQTLLTNDVHVTGIHTACNWTGSWIEGGQIDAPSTMTLQQSVDEVNGRYSHNDGEIHGITSGKTLNGTWSENSSEGTFVFIIADDCNSFTGTWSNYDGSSGIWTGTRKEI